MGRPRPTKSSYEEEWKRLWEPDLEAIAYNGATCDPTRVDPKVLQGAKQNCSHKPHFIKIVNNDAAPNQPRIASLCKLGAYSWKCMHTVTNFGVELFHQRFPIPFAEKHFRELKRVVRLENEDGQTWKVCFHSVRWHPTWQTGWFQFACDNNLKPGDIIVFVLVGNSHFHFKHFDKDGNTNSTCTPNDIAQPKKECTSHSSRSHEESDSVWDAEDEQYVKAGDSKCTPASLSKNGGFRDHAHAEVVSSGLWLDRHGQVGSQCASTDKQEILDPPPCKRRRLCKVGETLKECRN